METEEEQEDEEEKPERKVGKGDGNGARVTSLRNTSCRLRYLSTWFPVSSNVSASSPAFLEEVYPWEQSLRVHSLLSRCTVCFVEVWPLHFLLLRPKYGTRYPAPPSYYFSSLWDCNPQTNPFFLKQPLVMVWYHRKRKEDTISFSMK